MMKDCQLQNQTVSTKLAAACAKEAVAGGAATAARPGGGSAGVRDKARGPACCAGHAMA